MPALSIRHRIMGLITLSVLSTLTMAGLAWYNGKAGTSAAQDLSSATIAVRASMNADMMHDAIRAEVFAAQLAANANDAAGVDAAAAEFEASAAEMTKSYKAAAESKLPPEADAAVKAAAPLVNEYLGAARQAIAALKAQPSEAAPKLAAYLNTFKTTGQALDKSGDAIESAARATQMDIETRLARGETVTLAVTTGALGALLVLSALVVKSIMQPLLRMLKAVRNLNSDDSDLSRRLPDAGAEFGDLSRLFNTFLDRVAQVVSNVQAAAREISSTSAQIASGNLDLSVRTEQTSASLQQAASSMEQITATVSQSTDSARQANQYAQSASEVAVKGGEAVSRVVATMDEINVASRKIGDIIGVIDGIAFQTNILALNAAVEAARAGEQGRGFAVVAGEVRTLAQRSAEAAREIKGLISTSVQKVEVGSQLVRDAGATMDEIVASVSRVNTMIQEITHAASEQSAGIVLVNETVSQLDHSTQQNTALVEETAAAAKDMADQAKALEQTVSVFNVARAGA